MKTMFAFLTALLFNAVTGAAFGAVVGVSPVAGALGMNAISAVVGTAMPSGVMRAGVLKEIWTGEMVKALRELLAGTWLDGIPDNSSLVDNDVNWNEAEDNLLMKCTAAYHDKVHEFSIIYGDYYFVEALMKLSGKELFIW